jgi:pimeloyl-ACP methyl ester carboxylesterase
MSGHTTHSFETDDGARLTYYELGEGRPLVLLHGYMLPAVATWLESGIAARLAAERHRVIMPDLRGHGASVPANDAYPADALTTDTMGLITHLELDQYDLGGYSLGARIVARLLALGATPQRAVIGGTGLDPIVHAAGRGGNYRRIFANLDGWEPGTPEAQLAGYVRQLGGDPVALTRIFDTFVDTSEGDLANVQVPTLVVAGQEDAARGSVEDLAAIMPGGRAQRIPGDHYSALISTAFTDQLVSFLSLT